MLTQDFMPLVDWLNVGHTGFSQGPIDFGYLWWANQIQIQNMQAKDFETAGRGRETLCPDLYVGASPLRMLTTLWQSTA